jgi:hypothetical protein
MSDGNTATNIGPVPTENEMNMFRQMLDRALNAIVQSSELAHKVEGLNVQVQEFLATNEQLRRTNASLDEMLAHVRSQRDEVQGKLTVAILRNSELETKVNALNSTLEGRELSLKALKDELKRESDLAVSYYHEATTYAEENDKLKSALKEAHEWAQRIGEMFKQPEPPKPSPATASADEGSHYAFDERLSSSYKPNVQEGPREPVPTPTAGDNTAHQSSDVGQAEGGGHYATERQATDPAPHAEPVYYEGQRVGYTDPDAKDLPDGDPRPEYPFLSR